MTVLLAAYTIGLILALVALGVYVSSRILNFRDLTVDGAFSLGAAATAALLIRGTDPYLATAAGFAAGALAGAVTGWLNAKLQINGLLAGILVMTALFSVNLRIMGRSNLPLMETATLADHAEAAGKSLVGDVSDVILLGSRASVRDLGLLVLALAAAGLAGVALYVFFRTDVGTAMRATGDNDQMMTALGINAGTMTVAGLALSNGLVGLSGALFAQYQGFADVQMGIGMLVWGLASVILGEALVGSRQVGWMIVGTLMGAVLFRLLVAIALRAGMDPNDLKLITAVFVLAALVLPDAVARLKKNVGRLKHA